MKNYLLISVVLILSLLSFSGCKKSESKLPEQTPAVKTEKNEPAPAIVFEEKDVDLFIKHSKGVNEIALRHDEELKNLKNRSESGKIFAAGKKEISEYLTGAGLNPDDYMKKSGRIIRVYLAKKLKNDPAVMEEKKKAIEGMEKDPAKKQELFDSAKKVSDNLYNMYMRGITKPEEEAIDKRFKDIDALMKDQKITM